MFRFLFLLVFGDKIVKGLAFLEGITHHARVEVLVKPRNLCYAQFHAV